MSKVEARGRPKKTSAKHKLLYFENEQETDVKIVQDLLASNRVAEAQLYFEKKLYEPFYKMCIGIINARKFYNIYGYTPPQLAYEGIVVVWSNIIKYNRNNEKGSRAYSYFTVLITNFYKDLYVRCKKYYEVNQSKEISYEAQLDEYSAGDYIPHQVENSENFSENKLETEYDIVNKKIPYLILCVENEIRKLLFQYDVVKGSSDKQVLMILYCFLQKLKKINNQQDFCLSNSVLLRECFEQQDFVKDKNNMAFLKAKSIINYYRSNLKMDGELKTNLLSLDVSSKMVGYAVFDGITREEICLDKIDVSKITTMNKKLDSILQVLSDVIRKHQIGFVVVEDMAKNFTFGQTNNHTIVLLVALNQIIRYVLYRDFGIESVAMHVSTVRSLTGVNKFVKVDGGGTKGDVKEAALQAAQEWIQNSSVSKEKKDECMEKMCGTHWYKRKGTLKQKRNNGSYDIADAYLVGRAWLLMADSDRLKQKFTQKQKTKGKQL